MANLNELAQNFPNVSVTITLSDLLEFHKSSIDDYKKFIECRLIDEKLNKDSDPKKHIKDMLTMDDMALMLGIGKPYLYKLTSAKIIPHCKPTGKLIYFDRLDVENWIRQSKVLTADELESQVETYLATGRL